MTDPCSYKSKDRNNLINHIDEHIGKKDDTKHDIADVIVIKEDSIIFEKEAVTVSEVKYSNAKTTCCDDCDFITLSAIDMETHVEEQHWLKELLSCNQCDFDTESRIELQDHMAKNIHDINIKNKTIPAATKCHKCEYETNDPNSMYSHVVSLLFCSV